MHLALDTKHTKHLINITLTEIARQIHKARYMTEVLGGLFPEQSNPFSIGKVLDLLCGPGAWALDVALTYPSCTATGIDTDQELIWYAQALGEAHPTNNVHFELIEDLLNPKQFSPGSFDLINGSLLIHRFPRAYWPDLFHAYYHVLRPGGVIRIIESTLPQTPCRPVATYLDLYLHALSRVGRNYRDEDQTDLTIPQFFSQHLANCGYQSIQTKEWTRDIAPGIPGQFSVIQDLRMAFQLLRAFLVGMQVGSQPEIEELYACALEELQQERFYARETWVSVWAEKPLEASA